MPNKSQLQGVRGLLVPVVAALRAAAGRCCFTLLQFVVGAPFTLLIVIQQGVAWLFRCFHEPDALQKVQAARNQHNRAIASGATAASQHSQDGQPQQRMHVFPDPQAGHDSLAWQLIGPYMRAYGRHAIANSQLFNPEYVHFFVPGVGSLPYVVADIWNRVVIIGTGEPIAPRSAWRQLTEAFLQEFPKAYFYHITEEFADLLHDMGYWINGCGTETTLQVQSWTYTSKTRVIRASARAARDAGVRVRELAPEELTDELRAKLLHDVTGCWMQQKAIADRELRVFVRHVDFENMELRDGVRIFVAEAYDPAVAPEAYIDPVLQGAAINAKPPKPPRRTRSQGISLTSSVQLSTSNSSLSSGLPSMRSLLKASSSGNMLNSPLPSIGDPSSHNSDGSITGSPTASSMGSPLGCIARVQVLSDQPALDSGAKPGARAGVSCFAPAREIGATDHQASKEQQQPDTAAYLDQNSSTRDVLGPELVGFMLLDPLWEQGQEVGYVASVMRMKRSAHTGTLKLLIEDVISKIRREGKKEFTFGFAPLFNINDGGGRRYLHWIRWVAMYLYYCANNVYAFKNLAFSKVRYGGGLDKTGNAFNDPNVTLTHVYMACKHYTPGWNMIDLYAFFAFIGIIDNPVSVFLKLLGLKKGGENLN